MKKQKSKSLNNKEVRKATTLPGMDNSWPDPNPKRPSNDPNYTTGPDAFVDYDLDIRDAKVDNPPDHPTQADWSFYAEPKAPAGKPNILYIVIDDTGFGAWSMFGGKIQMPNLERIANKGLIYTNFHTTALCSPTRSSLLNGRNANSNGMACIEEATSPFPGSSGRIPKENALIAETLGERGYNTYCVGKWHLAPEEEANMASTKRNWPVGRGFERYYGFLGGETDQWYPDLIYDNHIVEPPYKPDMSDPEKGYHLSKDLVDKAIEFIQDGRAISPTKPWLLYFSPGANHAPHQIWPALIGNPGYPNGAQDSDGNDLNERCRYNTGNFTGAPITGDGTGYGIYENSRQNSVFKLGYENYRTEVFGEMQRLGIFPDNVEISDINPHGEGVPGEATLYNENFVISQETLLYEEDKTWPSTEYVIPWGDVTSNDSEVIQRQELFIRMAETYAAFSTYTDRQIGRLLDYLEDTEQFNNTIIIAVADNGASGEGGPNGSVNENLFFNDIPDDLNTNMAAIGDLGTDKTYNHYPSGWAWAFDTPFKYWKRWSNYEGGDATPFMICGPCIQDSDRGSGFRKQYVHAIDLVPTLYEYLGLDEETDIATVKGYQQTPIEGTSFAYTFDAVWDQENYQYPYKLPAGTSGLPANGEVKDAQFYAMLGTRGIWYKGWHACTFHPPTPSDWGEFKNDTWELYCMDGDKLFIDSPFCDIYETIDEVGNALPTDPGYGGTLPLASQADIPRDPTQRYNLMDDNTLEALGFDDPFLVRQDLDQILTALQAKWFSEARRYYGMPLDDRSTSEVLGEARPQLSDPPFAPDDGNENNIFDYGPYYPGGAEIPEAVAPNIRTRSYSITARLRLANNTTFDDDKSNAGVLMAHGGRFGGHTLYLQKEGDKVYLCYAYNWLGQRLQRVRQEIVTDWNAWDTENLLKLQAAFDREPYDDLTNQTYDLTVDQSSTGIPDYGSSTIGTVKLSASIVKLNVGVDGSISEDLVSTLFSDEGSDKSIYADGGWGDWTNLGLAQPNDNDNKFITQPAKFALSGEGFNIGRDGGQPVTDYTSDQNATYTVPGEFEEAIFTDAAIKDVVVTIQNNARKPNPTLEMKGMLWRD